MRSNHSPLLTPVVVLAALLVGCSSGSVPMERVAAPGAPLSAEVTLNGDGTLYADRLLVSKDLAEDDDDIECEDGFTPEGAVCDDDDDDEGEDADEEDDDGDHEDADEEDDDGEDDDNIECEDGFTPEGVACEDDDQDEDGDGDVDEDDARYKSGGAPAYVQGAPELDTSRHIYRLLGIEVNPGVSAVPEGIVRFDGGYTDGYLAASQAAPGTSVTALGGSSEGVVKEGKGKWTIQLLGRSVYVDGDTEIVLVSDPMTGEDDEGDESDGVNCEQEGEHEGENEGC